MDHRNLQFQATSIPLRAKNTKSRESKKSKSLTIRGVGIQNFSEKKKQKKNIKKAELL